MPKINGKIYYNNVTGNVLLVVNQNEGVWLRETTFAEDVATYPQLNELSGDVISVIRLAWDQYKQDLAVSRPVKVEGGTVTWVPFDTPEAAPVDKPFSERSAELEHDNKRLRLQNEAHTTQYQFLEDVVTELILKTY